MKYFLFVLYALAAVSLGWFAVHYIQKPDRKQKSIPSSADSAFKTTKTKSTPLFSDTLTLVASGDITMGTDFPSPKYLPPDSGKHLFEGVKDFFKKGDIVFGNMECVLQNGGTYLSSKPCIPLESCYLFHCPTYYVNNIVNAGYNLLSIANNHANDYGQEGRLSTKSVLEKTNIQFAGIIEKPYAIFEKKGLKIGFAAFAPNVGIMHLNNYPENIKLIKKLDSLCDIVIVSFHGGAEGEEYEHVPFKEEFFLGHSRGDVHKFAHTMIDAGADILLGHSPHVPRALEVYKNRFIVYSLGNFCTPTRINLMGAGGFAPIIELKVNKKGEFIKGKIIPIYQKKMQGPRYDSLQKAIKRVKKLTEEDFPNGVIQIDNEGNITFKPPKSLE